MPQKITLDDSHARLRSIARVDSSEHTSPADPTSRQTRMKGEISASLSIAAAVMLVACASKESASSRSADASTQDETAAEYQRLADNVNQQLSCKRQTVLGSRVPT